MFRLIDELDGYFDLINDEDFVLGVDKTGVYAFTSDTDVDNVLLKYTRMLRTLALKQSEAVLCVITEEPLRSTSTMQVVAPEFLERWVRQTVGARKTVFSKAELDSIFDCYFESEDDEDSVADILREFSLPEPVVISLINDPPERVQDITKFGIDKQVAYEVLSVFHKSVEHYHNVDSSEERGVTVMLFSFIKRNVIISCALAGMAVICLLLDFWQIALLFSAFGIVRGRKAEKVNDAPSAKFIKWANILLLFVAVCPILKLCVEQTTIWLLRQGFIGQ